LFNGLINCSEVCCLFLINLKQVALAVSLNLRTFLRLQSTSSGEVHINLPSIDTFLSWEITALQPLLAGSKGEERWMFDFYSKDRSPQNENSVSIYSCIVIIWTVH